MTDHIQSKPSELRGPLWINTDILPGHRGKATPLDPNDFLAAAVTSAADTDNPCYSWEMVREMEAVSDPETAGHFPCENSPPGPVVPPATLASTTVRQVQPDSVDRPD
ncbi:protein FAM151B-like isoform X1 [Salmo trutta]|uniref:protein FAM151B-like isoform X1 n=1 Tax=Salmo trutta TaxID=8032 RepID=UPI001131A8BF|nr:protein FAM151B-like isoform X1 [Salmo trutta]